MVGGLTEFNLLEHDIYEYYCIIKDINYKGIEEKLIKNFIWKKLRKIIWLTKWRKRRNFKQHLRIIVYYLFFLFICLFLVVFVVALSGHFSRACASTNWSEDDTICQHYVSNFFDEFLSLKPLCKELHFLEFLVFYYSLKSFLFG